MFCNAGVVGQLEQVGGMDRVIEAYSWRASPSATCGATCYRPSSLITRTCVSTSAEWRSRWKRLHTPADIDAWLAGCSLGVAGVESTRRDLAAAHEMREGLWIMSQAVASGESSRQSAIEVVNAHARHPALRRRFAVGGSAEWHRHTARAAFATIAHAAIELLSTDINESGLRRCAGDRSLPSVVRRHIPCAPPTMVLDAAMRKPSQSPLPRCQAVALSISIGIDDGSQSCGLSFDELALDDSRDPMEQAHVLEHEPRDRK